MVKTLWGFSMYRMEMLLRLLERGIYVINLHLLYLDVKLVLVPKS